MKTAFAFLLPLLASASLLHADYVVVQKVDGGMQSGEMTIKIKDGKARVDMAPQISTISDSGSGDVITLMHTQKQFMRIPAAQTKALVEQMQKLSGTKAQAVAPKLTATGRKEKVGEYECEVYAWSAGGMTVNYWLADKFPDYSKVQAALESTQNAGLTSMMSGMMPRSSEFPGMAVKTEMSVAGQKVTTTLVSVKEQEVDPVVFELPKDYKEMATPAFNLPAQPAPQP
ncbi:MAG TPA: DUF4412 domain-containing protein [Chthoniobacteraceae bacterium]|jgi:hypothetical protein